MEYEIDFEVLDPVSNNPSLDNIVPVNPKALKPPIARYHPKDRKRDTALAIPEEEYA